MLAYISDEWFVCWYVFGFFLGAFGALVNGIAIHEQKKAYSIRFDTVLYFCLCAGAMVFSGVKLFLLWLAR